MTATGRSRHAEFEPAYHHYGPHRAGLPPLIPYFREVWRRRGFAAEMSRATMRGANTSTFFGQAWLILNPLLLAAVYYVLVTIIPPRERSSFFANLTLGISHSSWWYLGTHRRDFGDRARQAAAEYAFSATDPVVGGAYGVFRFLPTVPVYFVVRTSDHTCGHPNAALLVLPGTMIVFAMGLAAFFAALQVYFRDTSSFLPSSCGSGCTCPRSCGPQNTSSAASPGRS